MTQRQGASGTQEPALRELEIEELSQIAGGGELGAAIGSFVGAAGRRGAYRSGCSLSGGSTGYAGCRGRDNLRCSRRCGWRHALVASDSSARCCRRQNLSLAAFARYSTGTRRA